MKTTTYTKQQVIDFINAQPDEKGINFSESYSHPIYGSPTCGCLLLQMIHKAYPEEVGKYGASCSFSWADTYDGGCRIETPVINPGSMTAMSITTYGQLKQHIDQLFTE